MAAEEQKSPPLAARMQQASQQQREVLRGPIFTRRDYARLLEMAAAARERLAVAAVALPADNRLDQAAGLIERLLAELEKPEDQRQVPPGATVYAAGLEIGQLAHIAMHLARPNGPWNGRIGAVLAPAEGDDEAAAEALRDGRFRLQFLGMCRQAELRLEAAPPLEALVELSRWRVGLAARAVEAPNLIEAAVASAAQRLRSARLPGLIVLEVSRVIWPDRTVLRAASAAAAGHELQRRVDHFLRQQHDTVAAIVDPALVFGVVAVATIPAYLEASGHVAFHTSFRIASLCDSEDPRHQRLVAFARRFERLS